MCVHEREREYVCVFESVVYIHICMGMLQSCIVVYVLPILTSVTYTQVCTLD